MRYLKIDSNFTIKKYFKYSFYLFGIWKNENLKMTIDGHSRWVFKLTKLNNCDLVSLSANRTIRIWNTKNGSLKMTLSGHSDSIYSIKLLKNGYLASGSNDANIRIWK